MKTLNIFIILFVTSCSFTNTNTVPSNKFVQMNDIWKIKASREKIIKYFGSVFEKVQDGISYNYKDTHFTEMAFFFDKNNKLNDQFAIVDEMDLKAFTSSLPCDWKVLKIKLDQVHIIKEVESGECLNERVKYFFRKEIDSYEIRWF